MSRGTRIVAVLVLSLSLGLHWTVVQSVAWAGMLVTRSHAGSFATALRTTFDGQHPCKLCKAVADGRATEKSAHDAPGASFVPKLELCPAPDMAFQLNPPTGQARGWSTPTVRSRGPDSPVPPPPCS